MIRVVLDTNILISALLQPQGLPARTFVMVLAGTTAQLCVSGDVYAEYEEVTRRPKFNRSEMIIDHALRATDRMDFGSSRPKGCMPALIPMTTFSWSAPRPHPPTTS
jgi:predicted nucleic acid-binding protein